MLFEIISIGIPFVMAAYIGVKRYNIKPKQKQISSSISYQPTVQLVLELLRSEPSTWERKKRYQSSGLYYFVHPLNIMIYDDNSYQTNSNDYFLFTMLFVDNKEVELTQPERKVLVKEIAKIKHQRLQREKDFVAKELARRILERKQRFLGQSQLGRSGQTKRIALESPQKESLGYISSRQAFEFMSANSVELKEYNNE